MRKAKIFILSLAFLIVPAIVQAMQLDSLKADFLQGNYRRVIFEGRNLAASKDMQTAEEVNYLLGLSYLKEADLSLAQASFQRILQWPSAKLKAEASLGLGDVYLLGGQFAEAEKIYRQLLESNADNKLKGIILYRLSQCAYKQGNNAAGNDYLFKLKKDFPLSPELKFTQGIAQVRAVAHEQIKPAAPESVGIVTQAPVNSAAQGNSPYCVQVGFFSSRDNAANLRDKLTTKGYPAYVEQVSGGYRVRVGKFSTEKEALELENKLSREGFSTKICP